MKVQLPLRPLVVLLLCCSLLSTSLVPAPLYGRVAAEEDAGVDAARPVTPADDAGTAPVDRPVRDEIVENLSLGEVDLAEAEVISGSQPFHLSQISPPQLVENGDSLQTWLQPFESLSSSAGSQAIQITESGFDPVELVVFGPTDVTWINTTGGTLTLKSGDPPETEQTLYLPTIHNTGSGQTGRSQALAQARSYLVQTKGENYQASLGPGQSYSHRFNAPGAYRFHLAENGAAGTVVLTGTALLKSSPSDREDGVSSTRETILTFSGALRAETVTTDAFTARFGSRDLPFRLHLSPDRTLVTLFYQNPLPGNARVQLTIDGNKLQDATGLAVDVDGDGLAGGVKTISFDTLSLTVVPGTSVCGRVFASELEQNRSGISINTPLQGATITVDGLESTLRTTTDANGNFCLDPAPAGHFFVHIDGRTASNGVPAGAYYPYVGKAWASVIGQQTDVGDAFLPLVMPGTLQPVSEVEDTFITFPEQMVAGRPEFEGVSILVPAGSLYSDDGTRGGQVGIAPVPPDRLPGQLPEGLEFPVVITVQTDGATNFDVPVPVCFPNLPDPVTGIRQAPGTKDYLFSFDHDTGAWGAIGSMTVTEDGSLVCSDPGVGIRAPGWHGSGPPPSRPPPPPPPCEGACCVRTSEPNGLRGSANSYRSTFLNATDEFYSDAQVADSCECTNPAAEAEEEAKCINDAERIYNWTFAGCTTAYAAALATACTASTLTGPGVLGCLALASAGFTTCVGLAAETRDQKIEDCRRKNPCNTETPATSQVSLLRQSEVPDIGDPIADEIALLMQQIHELLSPHIQLNAEIPQDVLDEVQELLLAANGLAGGNAVEYLRDYRLKLEMEAISANGNLIQRIGNAPAYRIMYAAEIDGTDSTWYLRGLTEPYGQYVLFLPRNQSLRSVSFYDPQTHMWGIISPYMYENAAYQLPALELVAIDGTFSDLDSDGAVDVVEVIYGTSISNPDSDGDGIQDGVEIAQGTDPLDGLPARTGIIASVNTPGTAVDVCAANDRIVVANSEVGLSFFNVFNGMTPTIIAQVDTPGNAQAVACAEDSVAVADGAAGLAIANASNPAAIEIAQQVDVGSAARAVAVADGIAFVGTEAGEVVAVDLTNGAVLGRANLGAAIEDVTVTGDSLLALTRQRLYTFASLGMPLTLSASVASPRNIGGSRRWRLFAGDGIAYASHPRGYNTFDISNPAHPVLLANGVTQQFGWKQIVTNGSGLGIAAVSPNSTNDGPHHISLYDVSDPTQTDLFLTQFETPGLAAAVALYNGQAYVADSEAGLQVINYRSFESQGNAPTIELASNFAPGVAEEQALMRLTANTSDDVQVRNVTFYIDQQPVFTDGNFPFEYHFRTPALAQQSSFLVRARATDTGGNETWTNEQVVRLVTDATPPRVTALSPVSFAAPGAVTTLSASFNEDLDAATVNADTFQLFAAGSDGILDTEDDQPVTGTVTYAAATRTASLALETPLPEGRYRAVLKAGITDVAGNGLANGDFSWRFSVGVVIWDGGGDGVSWHDAANWVDDQLPIEGSTVIIEGAGSGAVIYQQGELAIGSLHSTLPLHIFGGALTVNGLTTLGDLSITGGTLLPTKRWRSPAPLPGTWGR